MHSSVVFIHICLYALETHYKIISYASLNHLFLMGKSGNEFPLLMIDFKIVTITHATALCSGKILPKFKHN